MTRCLVISDGRVAGGPYGIDELVRRCSYQLVDVAAAEGRAHRKLRDVIEHRSGVRVDKAVRSLRLAHDADIRLFMNEGVVRA